MYAKVVFNLPIEGPFDYAIPAAWGKSLKPGMRVSVSFGKRRRVGYAVGLSGQTQYKKLNSLGIKPILDILDEGIPVLDRTMLEITREVAGYYACSWGEAIETAVPVSLRRGKKIRLSGRPAESRDRVKKRADIALLQDVTGEKRWEIYFREISPVLNQGKAVILLAADRESAELIHKLIKERFSIEAGLLHSYQTAKNFLEQWIDLKSGRQRMVVGTRLAVFAPLARLGLIIIDEEQSQVYKQDSAPHYNAVGVARIRARIEGAKLILSSRCPTLETWHQARKGKIGYILEDAEFPACKTRIVDLRRVGFIPGRKKMRLSITLEDAIGQALKQNTRVLLFLNRRGFAISAVCQKCGMALRCPRCNANLTLHFKNNRLTCHRCNYAVESLKICPNCNSGYIHYSGLGTEKLESELHRIYPQFGISRLDKDQAVSPQDAGIIVSTESVFKYSLENFGLVGVLWPDTALNLPDFRAAEKLYALLLRLSTLTSGSMVIQTNHPSHYCFQALVQGRTDSFYETELKFRRQSRLPPFRHLIIVSLRGRQRDRVNSAAEELFNILNNANKDKSIKVDSFSSQTPDKKRDNFYGQILLKVSLVPKAVSFLKKSLANFRRSGIIITVDVDPA
ncbi:primosomal protein N' [Candidatus Omnitrophota bacterium]